MESTFKEKLKMLDACQESLEWVGEQTIEQAWENCTRSDWMMWILCQSKFDLSTSICDFAEDVLDLVPNEYLLSCIWAIDAARRYNSCKEPSYELTDELEAACESVHCACQHAYSNSLDITLYNYIWTADAAANCILYCKNSCCIAYGDTDEEKSRQADILRKNFSIKKVKNKFNRLIKSQWR